MENILNYTTSFYYPEEADYCVYTNIINDYIYEAKVNINDIQPMQIPSKEILKKIVDTTNPKAPKKDKGGKGLYAFNDLLKKESELANVGKGPLAPIYVCFMTNDGGKDPKSTRFYGIAGFSSRYFTRKNKAVADIDKKVLSKMKNFLHIIIWQTDPEYAKAGLAKKYLEILKDAAKEIKSNAITIKKGDDDTNKAYMNLGFKEYDELKDYLILPLGKAKTKQ